jgi:hypothetical protein
MHLGAELNFQEIQRFPSIPQKPCVIHKAIAIQIIVFYQIEIQLAHKRDRIQFSFLVCPEEPTAVSPSSSTSIS